MNETQLTPTVLVMRPRAGPGWALFFFVLDARMTQIESATLMMRRGGEGEVVLGQGEVAVDSVV